MSAIARSLDDVSVDDTVGYPGDLRSAGCRSQRDWLRVTRIKRDALFGVRVFPDDWERDVEFTVLRRQVEAHGVEINNRVTTSASSLSSGADTDA